MKNTWKFIAGGGVILLAILYIAIEQTRATKENNDKAAGYQKVRQHGNSPRIYEVEFDGHEYIVVETFRGIGVTKK